MVPNDQSAIGVLNPVGLLRFKPIPHAPRVKDLNNKKIGLYWNHKARGNVALDRVRERLSERFTGLTFEWFETPVSVEASSEWFNNVRTKGVDAFIASTGD
jgi:hypothetical protein